MFHKLHLQLTIFCTTVTSMILAALTLICLFVSESGIRQQETASFLTNVNALYQNLEQQTSLSHQWLHQMMYHYQLSIRLLDNGNALFYQELTESRELTPLLDLAQEAADAHGIDLHNTASGAVLTQHQEFSIRDQKGRPYLCSAARFPRTNGFLGVVILRSQNQMAARMNRQRLIFFLADLTAMLLLTVFSWYFTRRMILPLQESQKKQVQFVASASHELRSPLTVILSNVDAVKSGIMEPDRRFLNTVSSEGARMSRLISDMLQLAGADNHSWTLRPVPTEPDTLLLQVWESFESLAASRHINWKIRLPEESVPAISCDAERIRQLLSILLDNAFCYSQPGGTICLSLSNTSSSLHFSVSDNGPGIPDDQKKAVFERFYCIDSSRKNKAHFGLGLSIASEIARLHKGQILLTDTPGGGATFTVVLPL